MKLISVILPVYNAQDTIVAAIESVLKQTYSNLELIIIDDGSTDKTASLIEGIEDDRIIFKKRDNKGLGNTLNELLSMCSGDLVARMDADDICHPNRLEKQFKFMESNSDVVLLGGQIRFLVNNSYINIDFFPAEHEKILAGLMNENFPICHPTIMFRKKEALCLGGYTVGLAGEDLDFFLRIASLGKLANLDTVVLDYRILMNSLSSTKKNELNIGYSYAIYNENMRRNNLSEISYSDFISFVWDKRTLIERLDDFLKNWSRFFYRKSLFSRANGDIFFSLCYLFFAITIQPKRSLKRMLRRILK
ncbi:hypothetical protein AUQ44_07410 [Vibrio cidicii]|uniref:Glycosyltransferase 2-like domain-containing protein n=1 Tax=Vibrio cidicii TaxID=1763883 RepID=A0A151JHY4_9VIBR|nr:glycosyltransferase [Vibrio cidicii]KYN25409.1 hypothetical protein AUQ44_07410 [Vibrio cidicii]